MFKFTYNLIRGTDLFGHAPKFHFGSWKKRKDDCEEEYKTIFGGIFSVFIQTINVISFIYFAY